ncbi:MAG: tetratricopeptide repeat protein [Dysgonamonadaceae bacterium]|jgi:hypothetical protein|nr:tetratricopeptide repeat protein [Dysgonamonadaceae bacterium]
MTVNDIFKLIKSPELLNGDTLLQLKSLVEEYPYFQTVRMLYLKNLQVEKDLSFPMELRKMAFYAPDRKKLYFWIEKDKFASFNFNNLEEKEVADTFAFIDSFLTSENVTAEKLSLGSNSETLVSSDYFSGLSEDEKNNLTHAQPLKHQKTIDDFIEKDKQSSIKIKLNESANETSELPQLNEKTDFLSETLAKIYIKQKKYEKALQIIQKLSLQYPEKSAYFALQIEELKNLIINNK